jgi:hypothetical protein
MRGHRPATLAHAVCLASQNRIFMNLGNTVQDSRHEQYTLAAHAANYDLEVQSCSPVLDFVHEKLVILD